MEGNYSPVFGRTKSRNDELDEAWHDMTPSIQDRWIADDAHAKQQDRLLVLGLAVYSGVLPACIPSSGSFWLLAAVYLQTKVL